jgi:methyl-accepting chemotaxis protein
VNMDHDVSLGGYMMFINARVDGVNGPTGITGMSLSVDTLARSIAGYKIGQTGFAYLVHPDGAIMMHPDSALVDGKHFLKTLPGLSADATGKLLGGKPYTYVTYAAPSGLHSSRS